VADVRLAAASVLELPDLGDLLGAVTAPGNENFACPSNVVQRQQRQQQGPPSSESCVAWWYVVCCSGVSSMLLW
jgi:hypothetical protein